MYPIYLQSELRYQLLLRRKINTHTRVCVCVCVFYLLLSALPAELWKTGQTKHGHIQQTV